MHNTVQTWRLLMDFKVFPFSVKAELCGREFETTAEIMYELVASETD